MNRLLIPALAALAVGLSACTAQAPAAPEVTPTWSEGTPFLPAFIESLTSPPTSPVQAPQTWENLLLPPTLKESK